MKKDCKKPLNGTKMSEDKFLSHNDSRRELYEWIEDCSVRSLKAIKMNSNASVGDHFHRHKDEIFFLMIGSASKVIIGSEVYLDVSAPHKWVVPRNTYHVFYLEKDSILLSAATEPFDVDDEIAGCPT